MLAQAVLQLLENGSAILHGQAVLHHHMCHENRQTRRDGAGVQIMYGDYARHRFQMFAHLIEIQPPWGVPPAVRGRRCAAV